MTNILEGHSPNTASGARKGAYSCQIGASGAKLGASGGQTGALGCQGVIGVIKQELPVPKCVLCWRDSCILHVVVSQSKSIAILWTLQSASVFIGTFWIL